MAIQSQITLSINLLGDGSATSFIFSPNKLAELVLDSGEVGNMSTPAVSAAIIAVPAGWPAGSSATVDVYGNLTLNFVSAPPATSGAVQVQLTYVGSNLSTTTAAWTSATALNTVASVVTAGVGAVVLTYNPVSSAFTAGTIVFEASDDGGTTWYAINGERGNQSFVPDNAYILNAVAQTWQFTIAGFTNFRVRLSVAILGSGTANFHLLTLTGVLVDCLTVGQGLGKFLHTNIDGGNSQLVADTQAKGTQGVNALMTQDFHNSGRTYLSFTIQNGGGATSETLLSFNQNKAGTNTAGVSSYTITSGKTLRITAISVSIRSAAAAIAWVRLSLRHATGGATTNASPIAFQVPEVNTNSATSGTGAAIVVPIAEGIEFFGNGTQSIGMSQLAQATTNIINVTVYGYEY